MIKVIMAKECEAFPGFGQVITAIGELVWQERGKVVRREPCVWDTWFDRIKGEWNGDRLHEIWTSMNAGDEPSYALIQHWVCSHPLQFDEREEDGDTVYSATAKITFSDERLMQEYVAAEKVIMLQRDFDNIVAAEARKRARIKLPAKREFDGAKSVTIGTEQFREAVHGYSELADALERMQCKLQKDIERGRVVIDDRTGAVRVLVGKEAEVVESGSSGGQS